MAKKKQGNPMKNALAAAAASSTPEPVEETEATPAPANAPSTSTAASPSTKGKKRRGRPPGSGTKTKAETKLIGGHFDPAVARQFKITATEQGRTIQDLLGEALNDLFVKYKKKPIA